MNRTSRRFLLSLVLLIASWYSLVAALSRPAYAQVSPTAQVSAGDQSENADQKLLLPLKRHLWFVQQRAYPNAHIPNGAYWRALMQKQELVDARAKRLVAIRAFSPALAAQADPLATVAWTALGPQPVVSYYGSLAFSGRADAIAVDPTDPNTVYLGTAAGGVWKTTDGGTTWKPLTDSQASLAIGAVAVDPNNSKTIFAGTGEPDFSVDSYYGEGLLKSTDSGATWTLIRTPFGSGTTIPSFTAIAVQPGNSNVVLAGNCCNWDTTGVYRSADGGQTWAKVLSPGGDAGATSVMFDVKNPSIAYAGIGGFYPTTAGTVFMSTDSGSTWNPINGTGTTAIPAPTAVIRTALAESADGKILFAAFANSNFSAPGLLYSTTNSGSSWTQLPSPSKTDGLDWYRNGIAVSPTNPQVLYATGANLYQSIDGGQTWTTINWGGTIYADQHAFAFSADGTRMFLVDDGGVFVTTTPNTASTPFTSLNSTLNTLTFYPGFGLSPTTPDFLLAGSQDHGINLYKGSLAWLSGEQSGFCGDAGSIYVDPKGTYAYAHCVGGSANWTANATADASTTSWVAAQNGIASTDRAPWVADIKGDQQTVSTVYTATQRLYQSTNNASSWTPISADLTAGKASVNTIGVSPSDGNTIYTGAGDGTVSVTTNALAGASSSWKTLAGLPNRSVSKIVVMPDSPQNVYVTVSGFGAGHVFHSTNGGTSWTDISGDLPDTPTNSILPDPNVKNQIYLATDTGVYATVNGGVNWAPLGQGLPNVVVQDLLMYLPTRTLRVITHGRGAWQTAIPLIGLQSSTTSLTFANQVRGTTSATQVVTLNNNLISGSVNISAIQITGPFTQTNNCGSSLASGTTCSMIIAFAPTVAGSAQGVLTVTANTNTVAVSLTGTGLGIPNAVLGGFSLTFSSQAVGIASAAQTVQLSNTGDASLANIAVSLGGANAGDFQESDNCGASQAPGGSCTISVVFKSGSTGSRTATLSIADNAGNSPQTVALSGTGAAPYTVTALSTTAIVAQGSTASYQLNLAAVQGAPLATAVSFSCTGLPAQSTCTFSPSTVPTGTTSQTVTLSVSTTKATASVRSNALEGTALAGIGIFGILLLLPARRRRAWLWVLASVAFLGFSGCGGGGSTTSSGGGNPGTPAGSYTLTVTAAQSAVYSTTQQLTLTVQ